MIITTCRYGDLEIKSTLYSGAVGRRRGKAFARQDMELKILGAKRASGENVAVTLALWKVHPFLILMVDYVENFEITVYSDAE